jgi:hypothetical protein
MEHPSPDSVDVDARLRRLNLEIWNDVRRDLQRRGAMAYGEHSGDAVADLLMDLNLALIACPPLSARA